MIDVHSPTWVTVQRFINQELEDAIQALVADIDSDKQRGAIHVLDRLLKLPADPIEMVVSDHYK